MVNLLKSKSIYRIALGQESKPKDKDKISKLENKTYQGCGLIGMSISPEIRFHIA